MKKNLKQLIDKLGLECMSGKELLDREADDAYVSDLLSDVMGKTTENMLWVTSQAHKNIVAVASLKELSAIIIVNERKVEKDVLESAESEGVVILTSKLATFETVGKLYNFLHDIEM